MKLTLLLALGTVALAACTTTSQLRPTTPDAPISGTVTRGWLEPYRVEIVLDGKPYRGEWRTLALSPEQLKETSYPHRKHAGEVRTTLSAEDGSHLDCDFRIGGSVDEGTCIGPNKRQYQLRLK